MSGVEGVLTGKDYDYLCSRCRTAVDDMVELILEGPDSDDPEAPLMAAGDLELFCNGRSCLDTDFVRYGARQVWQVLRVLKKEGEVAAVKFVRGRNPGMSLDWAEELVACLSVEIKNGDEEFNRAVVFSRM